MKHALAATAGAAALILAASTATAAESDQYSKENPYGNPADTPTRSAPSGYSMFFIETVARHGSRSSTTDRYEEDSLDIWREAKRKNALTETGKTLERDIERFQAAEKSIGYGNLSELGRGELRGIGRRTAANYPSFFRLARKYDLQVATVTTEVGRTKQSAAQIREGLRNQLRSTLDDILAKPTEDDDLLRFDTSVSSTGKEMIGRIMERSSLRDHAEHTLRASYTRSFVDSLDNPVAAALDLHKLYSTAPGMQRETPITFARYVPKEDREALSFATDARLFYEYGPGIKGETNTFRSARPLLNDFFTRLDRRIDGGSTAAVFRVAHGETTMPFAALIKAPGSHVQASKTEAFSREKNPWRGSVAGRLAGNIEWTAFRSKDRPVLVTMRYNERPVPFHAGCTPYKRKSYYYTVSELKSCLG